MGVSMVSMVSKNFYQPWHLLNLLPIQPSIFTVFLSGFSADLLKTIAVMLLLCIPLHKYFAGMHFHY